jgi:uncharacterized membrane protein (TIGR02234 family)
MERNITFGGTISGAGKLNIQNNTANSQENSRRLIFGGASANTHTGGTTIDSVNHAAGGTTHIITNSLVSRICVDRVVPEASQGYGKERVPARRRSGGQSYAQAKLGLCGSFP